MSCQVYSAIGDVHFFLVFFCSQNPAYEMRIRGSSSGVCSADLVPAAGDALPRSGHRRIDDRRSRRQQRAGNLGWAAGGEQTVARGRSHGADVGIDANVGPLVEPARRRGLETTGKVATVITDKIGRAHV